MNFFLENKETLTEWLLQYSGFVLFAFLAFGIVGLPLPEESLMVLAGILMHKGHLNPLPIIFAAYAGSICGITLSYFLGKTVGHYFFIKYGGWVGLTEEKLQKAHAWFLRYGKWTLIIGYFIPGVRHFTGLSAGVTNLEYKQFALFAYSGAIIWATSFLSIGYYFSDYWLMLFEEIDMRLDEIIIIAVAIAFSYWILRSVTKRSP